jgi:sulfite exporter TauE/SafE
MLALAYAIIGAFVAAANHYFAHVGSTKGVLNAIIAILIWPLVLIGIDIRVS